MLMYYAKVIMCSAEGIRRVDSLSAILWRKIEAFSDEPEGERFIAGRRLTRIKYHRKLSGVPQCGNAWGKGETVNRHLEKKGGKNG